ncbi:MAG: DUF4127 family protein [Saprospiraceae bacterium]|nr:DUF4127 family protein [Saprospiraceae bacterium]
MPPGADEVSMLLLSRALAAKHQFQPKIKAIFSSEKMAETAMPFEDRPLSKTVTQRQEKRCFVFRQSLKTKHFLLFLRAK